RRAASPLEPWRRRTRRPARAARPGSWSSTDRRRAAATPLQVVPLPAAHEWFSCADAARRAWRGCFIRRAARYSRNVSERVSDVVRGDLVVILVTPRSPSLRSLRLGVNQTVRIAMKLKRITLATLAAFAAPGAVLAQSNVQSVGNVQVYG